MRQLKEEELKAVMEKLMKYIGENVRKLIENSDHHKRSYNFRLHRDRVFYAREDLLTASITIPRKHLVSVGTCIGKFTKTGKPILKNQVWFSKFQGFGSYMPR